MHCICLELFKFKFCKPHKEKCIALKSVAEFNIIQKKDQAKIYNEFLGLSIKNNQKKCHFN